MEVESPKTTAYLCCGAAFYLCEHGRSRARSTRARIDLHVDSVLCEGLCPGQGKVGVLKIEECKREEEEENMKLWWTSKVEVNSLADESLALGPVGNRQPHGLARSSTLHAALKIAVRSYQDDICYIRMKTFLPKYTKLDQADTFDNLICPPSRTLPFRSDQTQHPSLLAKSDESGV